MGVVVAVAVAVAGVIDAGGWAGLDVVGSDVGDVVGGDGGEERSSSE